MKKKKHSGVIVPMVTPLTANLEIDEAAVPRLFDSFYRHNIAPFILGTTGESASLSMLQRRALMACAGRYKKADTMLYVGIGSNVVSESIQLAAIAADNGADAVAATLPTYYALGEEEMRQYFLTLADACQLPLIIYNIPATTHMSIPLSLVDELSQHPNIIALKDSERSDERMQQALALWSGRPDFSYFIGWAARSAAVILGGGDGLIPSTGNLLPEIYAKMLAAANDGDKATVERMQLLSDRFGDLYQAGRRLGQSLCALKYLMKQEGLCESVVMPPLQSMNEAAAAELLQQYHQLKENYPV